jgi:hypothetical protein
MLITFFDQNILLYSLFKSILLIYTLKLYHSRLIEYEVESHSEFSPFGVECQAGLVHSGLSPSRD